MRVESGKTPRNHAPDMAESHQPHGLARNLKAGLAAVLVLIGGKIIWNFGLHKELHLVPYLDAHWSLLATVALVGGAIVASLWKTRPAASRPT